jgi:hypothetical protein
MTKRALPLLAAAAIAVSGCGDTGSGNVDTKQVQSVVKQFAAADGPKACALMSPDGLVNVYGGFTKPVAQARANCIAKSTKFKGAPVKLTVTKVIDGDTVKQGALSADGKTTYSVTLRKFGPSWRIDAITQHRTQ